MFSSSSSSLPFSIIVIIITPVSSSSVSLSVSVSIFSPIRISLILTITLLCPSWVSSVLFLIVITFISVFLIFSSSSPATVAKQQEAYNGQRLLDKHEQNIVICQWRPHHFYVQRECLEEKNFMRIKIIDKGLTMT